VISDLEADGLGPRVQDAWRPAEDQLKAFKSGHSKLKFGIHNVTGVNGFKEALAIDLLDDNAPLNPGPLCSQGHRGPQGGGGGTCAARPCKLNAVAKQLNKRPRKTLGYHMPAEMFSHTVASTA